MDRNLTITVGQWVVPNAHHLVSDMRQWRALEIERRPGFLPVEVKIAQSMPFVFTSTSRKGAKPHRLFRGQKVRASIEFNAMFVCSAESTADCLIFASRERAFFEPAYLPVAFNFFPVSAADSLKVFFTFTPFDGAKFRDLGSSLIIAILLKPKSVSATDPTSINLIDIRGGILAS